jgi:nucleotidyltransferase/DNA polymerase involved in DNA repair
MGCIPPQQDAAFVCQLEQVLQVYKRPYDAARPVVCMDEQPKQLISEARQAVPAARKAAGAHRLRVRARRSV